MQQCKCVHKCERMLLVEKYCNRSQVGEAEVLARIMAIWEALLHDKRNMRVRSK